MTEKCQNIHDLLCDEMKQNQWNDKQQQQQQLRGMENMPSCAPIGDWTAVSKLWKRIRVIQLKKGIHRRDDHQQYHEHDAWNPTVLN